MLHTFITLFLSVSISYVECRDLTPLSSSESEITKIVERISPVLKITISFRDRATNKYRQILNFHWDKKEFIFNKFCLPIEQKEKGHDST